jgi:hypothetical protein
LPDLHKLLLMKQVSFLGLCALIFFACSDSGKPEPGKASVPAAPTSMRQVKDGVKKGNYTVEKLGFSRLFMGEAKPIRWEEEMQDTSEMYRNFVAGQKKLRFEFTGDSTLNVHTGTASYPGSYSVDTLREDDEEEKANSMKLRISYADPDSPLKFPGDTTVRKVTYTYKVRGVDENRLMLEAPSSFNDQYAVLLMKKD